MLSFAGRSRARPLDAGGAARAGANSSDSESESRSKSRLLHQRLITKVARLSMSARAPRRNSRPRIQLIAPNVSLHLPTHHPHLRPMRRDRILLGGNSRGIENKPLPL